MEPWTRRVAEIVAMRAGLDLARCRCIDMPAVLRRLARQESLSGPQAVVDAADAGNSRILDRLVAALLVHETFFYRYGAQLEAIERDVLVPALRSGASALRLWSAGCSIGPEAHTLAMVAARACQVTGSHAHVSVVGTDLSSAALEVARRGVYPTSSVADLPTDLRERYILEESSDEVRVSPELARGVRFERHNVCDRPPMGRFHVICCRNVLMYLKQDAAQRAVTQFAGALEQEGVLAVGHGESLRSFDAVGPDRSSALNLYRPVVRQRDVPAAPTMTTPTPTRSPAKGRPKRTATAAPLPPVTRLSRAGSDIEHIALSGTYDARATPQSLERLQATLARAVSSTALVHIDIDGADSLDAATARLILRAIRSARGKVVVIAKRPASRRWAQRHGLVVQPD